VAARASGSRELIIEAENGFTYAHGDVQQMEEMLQRCLSSEGVTIGKKARAMAERQYSIQAITDRYEALYVQLLAQK